MFLAQKKFKIKTQKYKTPNGQFWSQGLLMAPEDFNWYMNDIRTAIIEMDATNDEGYHAVTTAEGKCADLQKSQKQFKIDHAFSPSLFCREDIPLRRPFR